LTERNDLLFILEVRDLVESKHKQDDSRKGERG